MASNREILVTLGTGRKVDARLGKHLVKTDQPLDNGGEDTAPSPFDYFLASIGACAGLFVQSFCQKRGIPTDGIEVIQRPTFGDDGVLKQVALDIRLPAEFPEKYRDAVIKVAEQCSVKKAIAAQPIFTIKTVVAEGATAGVQQP